MYSIIEYVGVMACWVRAGLAGLLSMIISQLTSLTVYVNQPNLCRDISRLFVSAFFSCFSRLLCGVVSLDLCSIESNVMLG